MKHKNKRRRKKYYVLIKKRHVKDEKNIAQMYFAKYLWKPDVSENMKVYYGRFLRNGLHERYCYISKSSWDVQYLEKSASHCLLIERGRWNWMDNVFDGVCSSMSIRLLHPSFIKEQASSPCNNFLLLSFITSRLSM